MKSKTKKNKSLNQLIEDSETRKSALKKIVNGLNSNKKNKTKSL